MFHKKLKLKEVRGAGCGGSSMERNLKNKFCYRISNSVCNLLVLKNINLLPCRLNSTLTHCLNLQIYLQSILFAESWMSDVAAICGISQRQVSSAGQLCLLYESNGFLNTYLKWLSCGYQSIYHQGFLECDNKFALSPTGPGIKFLQRRRYNTFQPETDQLSHSTSMERAGGEM